MQRAVDEQTAMVYHRTFQLEAPHAGWRTLLHFGAVDHTCAVLVNGREAGRHTGGFCPFCFDITPYLRGEENELTVCVWDATDAADSPRGKQVRQPKGIWYTGVSGIWQTVWLEQVPAAYIRGLRFTPSLEGVTAVSYTHLSLRPPIYFGTTGFTDDQTRIVFKCHILVHSVYRTDQRQDCQPTKIAVLLVE